MIATVAPAKLSRNEGLKAASATVAGTIAKTLANPALDRFSDDEFEFLKFHGIYRLDKENVKPEVFAVKLRLLFARFARERLGLKRFGDFCDRVVLPESATIAVVHA